MRHDVQRIGHNHNVKGLGRIGQAKHILHRKIQLCRAVIPLGFGNHFRRSIRRFDMLCRADDVLHDQPRAGGKLQNRFGFHNRSNQLVHLPIRRRVLSHEAVIPLCIFIPEIRVRFQMFPPPPNTMFNPFTFCLFKS